MDKSIEAGDLIAAAIAILSDRWESAVTREDWDNLPEDMRQGLLNEAQAAIDAARGGERG